MGSPLNSGLTRRSCGTAGTARPCGTTRGTRSPRSLATTVGCSVFHCSPDSCKHVVAVEALVGLLGADVAPVGDAHARERHLLVLVHVRLEVRGPLVAVHAVARLARHAQVGGVRDALGPCCVSTLQSSSWHFRHASRVGRRELEVARCVGVARDEAAIEVADERDAVFDRLRLVARAAADALVGRVLEVDVAAVQAGGSARRTPASR